MCPVDGSACRDVCTPGERDCACDSSSNCVGGNVCATGNVCVAATTSGTTRTPTPTPAGGSSPTTGGGTPSPTGATGTNAGTGNGGSGNNGDDPKLFDGVCKDDDRDGDGDGEPDCRDSVVNLGNATGDVIVVVFDGANQPLGAAVFEGEFADDGTRLPPGPLTSADGTMSVDEVTVTAVVVNDVPDGKGGVLTNRRGLSFETGAITAFASPRVLVCITGPLPPGYTTTSCCLGVKSDGSTWECGDSNLMPGSFGMFCGFAPHFSTFTLMPNPNAGAVEDRAALEGPDLNNGFEPSPSEWWEEPDW